MKHSNAETKPGMYYSFIGGNEPSLLIHGEIMNCRCKTFCSGSWPRIYCCRSRSNSAISLWRRGTMQEEAYGC